MKVRILINDPINRFERGEIGTLLTNDSTKYDYFVDLPPIPIDGKTKMSFLDGISVLKRRLYFYKDEVELLPED